MRGAMTPVVRLRVLGPVEVDIEGEAVDLGGPRLRTVLTLLAFRCGQALSTSSIAEVLWDEPAISAEETVHVYISRLRKALGGRGRDLVESTPGGYRLSAGAAERDADVFERLVAEGHALLAAGEADAARECLRAADGLWRGEPYVELIREDTIVGERHRLLELRHGLRTAAVRADLAAGNAQAALAGARQLLTDAPLDETAWALSMHALFAMGRQADALAAYHEVRARLEEELGVAPGPILEDAQRAILAQHSSLPASTAVFSAGVKALQLDAPEPISRLIGRGRDLDVLADAISQHRLVTVTGPGGVGKTRLALELVRRVAGTYPGGAGFIDLSSVREASLVPNAIRDALGVSAPAAQEAEVSVIEALEPVAALLVLDNLEQVLDSAQFLESLVLAAPQLRIVVTSRSPLGIRGEREVPVAPLALPPVEQVEAAEIANADAVTMFFDVVERQGGQAPDAEGLRIAGEICRRLDGLPLALELVAAHARTMSLAGLLERLRSGLDIAATSQGHPARQRTLRAAIRWSAEILSPAASGLLARCSVYVGGFTRSAAQAVAQDTTETDAALDELARHSLITFDAKTDRFHMLETVRDFAYRELHAAGAAEATHRLQASWLAETLHEVEDAWTRAKDRGAILDRADAERANVRVALAWASESGNNELALQLAAAKNFWAVRGGVLEGLRWLRDLLDKGAEVSPRTLALGRTALGGLSLNVGDLDTARDQFEAAKPMWEKLGERRRVAVVLNNLGIVSERLDQLDLARQCTEGALAIMRELEDPVGIAAAVGNLGVLADRLGDLTAAVAYNTESLAIARELNDPLTMSIAASNLGGAALKSGDLPKAHALFEEALHLSRKMDDVEGVIICCEMLAQIALEEGRPHAAAQILGATSRMRTESGFAAAPVQQRDLGDIETQARAQLGDDMFDELRLRGSALGASELGRLATSRHPEAHGDGTRT